MVKGAVYCGGFRPYEISIRVNSRLIGAVRNRVSPLIGKPVSHRVMFPRDVPPVYSAIRFICSSSNRAEECKDRWVPKPVLASVIADDRFIVSLDDDS